MSSPSHRATSRWSGFNSEEVIAPREGGKTASAPSTPCGSSPRTCIEGFLSPVSQGSLRIAKRTEDVDTAPKKQSQFKRRMSRFHRYREKCFGCPRDYAAESGNGTSRVLPAETVWQRIERQDDEIRKLSLMVQQLSTQISIVTKRFAEMAAANRHEQSSAGVWFDGYGCTHQWQECLNTESVSGFSSCVPPSGSRSSTSGSSSASANAVSTYSSWTAEAPFAEEVSRVGGEFLGVEAADHWS